MPERVVGRSFGQVPFRSVFCSFPEPLTSMRGKESSGPYEKIIQELRVNSWSWVELPPSRITTHRVCLTSESTNSEKTVLENWRKISYRQEVGRQVVEFQFCCQFAVQLGQFTTLLCAWVSFSIRQMDWIGWFRFSLWQAMIRFNLLGKI